MFIDFWNDDWVGIGPLFQNAQTVVPNHLLSLSVSHFWDFNGRRWELIRPYLDEQICLMIEAVHLQSNVQSMDPIIQLVGLCLLLLILNVLWNVKMRQGIRVFMWLVMQGRVLTNCERVRRGFTQDPMCALCGNAAESLSHLLRDYVFVQGIWREFMSTSSWINFQSWDVDFVA
ncbi:hypothetical protein P3X46_004580 [Hevea brasiliensis]|uniref:Reverse transcriptase zinc-binding domain-containing protein n=1 Tax=Hevea brasiliensis TaxID=3981 RepID=A0ABQ9MZV1_HEVBR|nr:hypothetical protein P3X46_004580 [Hevea brasiliensis]